MQPLTADMPVETVLKQWPETALLFRQWHLACAGCALARFCSLEAVADNYGLPLPRIMAALEQRIKEGES